MVQQGFYPDPPSRRMAYDEDGTIVLSVLDTSSTIKEFSTLERKTINSEDNSGSSSNRVNVEQTPFWITFIFPERRYVTHYYAAIQKTYHYQSIAGGEVQWSNNTTNGVDGDWSTVATSFILNSNNGNGQTYPLTTPGFPDMRLALQTLPIEGVRAIRFFVYTSGGLASGGKAANIFSINLYGHKFAGETPHRIDFAYADGAELMQDFDYGDQPRGTARIWSPISGFNVSSGLYLRNRSPDKVATDVTITMENLHSNMINRLTLSKDNSSYGTQLFYTSIQPLQIIGPVYVKHDVPAETTLGLYTARLRITVGEWQ
jgi:hypothetical protein